MLSLSGRGERRGGGAGDGEGQPAAVAQSTAQLAVDRRPRGSVSQAAALHLGCGWERQPCGTEPGSAATPSLAPASSVTLGKST